MRRSVAERLREARARVKQQAATARARGDEPRRVNLATRLNTVVTANIGQGDTARAATSRQRVEIDQTP